jgi:hypothetical protein
LLKPLSASASSNHPLINGNEIAEKDTNKISLSEIGDGVFSFISGAASGVAASLSMGLSDIFVINDDNKNETVYQVGRLTGAVVVATVAIVMTVRSGASAVSTAPTVVGTAVSVASVVDNGGKAISAIGVAGDTINTLIANGKESTYAGDGRLTGSLDKLTQAERTMVNDLLRQGKNVEIVPRSNVSGVKTPDFRVNGVLTELKTLEGTSLNTPVKRIQNGFSQGAQTVIIDGRATGITAEQANTVINMDFHESN